MASYYSLQITWLGNSLFIGSHDNIHTLQFRTFSRTSRSYLQHLHPARLSARHNIAHRRVQLYAHTSNADRNSGEGRVTSLPDARNRRGHCIQGNREAQSLCHRHHRGSNPNHTPIAIHQWPTGITGIYRRIRLNQVGHLTRPWHVQRAPQRAHHPCRHRPVQSIWFTHCDDQLANLQRRARHLSHRQMVGSYTQHRYIHFRIAADKSCIELTSISQCHLNTTRALYYVSIGQDLSVRREDETGTNTGTGNRIETAIAETHAFTLYINTHHRWPYTFGSSGHSTGISIQRLYIFIVCTHTGLAL